jgi:Bacterial Ig domain
MRKVYWIFFLSTCCATSRLRAQTVSFNFSNASHPVSGWINVAGDPSSAVLTGTDAVSGIGVSSVATANWSPFGNCSYDGGGSSGPSPFFPTAVLANHWFNYNGYYAGYNALMPQLVLSGLNIDSVYTLKMTGSFQVNVPGQFNLNPIRYTVAGATVYGYIDIDGDSNYAAGATFHNIAPDVTGKVRIYVNTYGGSNLASICGVQVVSGHSSAPTPTIALTNPTNGAIIPEDGNVTLSATASETGGTIARVEFYAGSTLIGSDSAAPYSLTWFSPNPGPYVITARAIDGTGNITTASANISVESLNYFWSTTGNIATGGDTSFVGTVDTNRLAFRTNNVERMTILKDGTVGIGTKVTDGYQLAVAGTAIFTQIKVKPVNSWPDYVFSKTYHLPTLDELERYIRAHHHLPGIISEQQEEKQGIDVAGQQTALLKKLEENTLYLIDQNKQLEKLNSRLAELDRQVRQLKQENQRLTKALKVRRP